ncbi:MAG: hypothetical protein ACK4EY_16145 [Flavipsychrobacter sp.]
MEFKPVKPEDVQWPAPEAQQDDMLWVKIKPVKLSIFNKKESVLMGMKPIGGKLKSHHNFYYCFASEDMEIQFADNMTISAEHYDKWAEDDMYPVKCIVELVPELELIEEGGA